MWAWLSYVSVACVISYVVCFAVGLGMHITSNFAIFIIVIHHRQ